nr:polysaccharide deacetylase family protein [Bacteroidota bacterium]
MILFNSFVKRTILREIIRHEGCPQGYHKYLHNIPQDIPLISYADTGSQIIALPGIGKRFPRETIARTNKALLRKTVINTLKEELFRKNLPYIHLSYYPKDFRTVVTFRVDCDDSDQVDFDRVLRYADSHSFPITWFIHVKAQQSYLHHIASIGERGHDIQLHCYDHETFTNYRQNKMNIGTGRRLLEESGIHVTGFASPFGKWNPSLNRVLENLRFSFSSEFASGYDDLPYYPVFGNRVSTVLQLPVHPVCIGLLRKAHFSREEMITYFDRIISEKFERNEPIMLYGHPYKEIDKFPEIFDFILSRLKKLPKVWITTYSEFASWWKKRIHTGYSVRIEKETAHIITDNSDPSLQLHIEMPDSSEMYLPLTNSRILLMN